MAEANIEVVMKLIHDPSCIYLHQYLTTEGIDMMELVTENTRGVDLHQTAAQEGTKDRGLGIDCDMLQSPVRGTHSHVIICSQHVIPGQDL